MSLEISGQQSRLKNVLGLFTGQTLATIQGERTRLEQCRDEIKSMLEGPFAVDLLREINTGGRESSLMPLVRLASTQTPIHRNTPLLLAAMRVNIPVWLYGEAGSGKTTAAEKVAEMLRLPFRLISVCPTTNKSEFLGYRDASGQYQTTPFREIYEHGGIFLIDEADNGNPSIFAVTNTALANSICAFADQNVTRHKNTRIIASANTIGRGADTKYIGRSAQDATTLDRFVFVRMDIDEDLEEALIGVSRWKKSSLVDISEGGKVDLKDWLMFVRKVRYACRELKIDHIVTPRAAIYGKKLIAAGVGRTHLEEMCVWKGIRETDRNKITNFMDSV